MPLRLLQLYINDFVEVMGKSFSQSHELISRLSSSSFWPSKYDESLPVFLLKRLLRIHTCASRSRKEAIFVFTTVLAQNAKPSVVYEKGRCYSHKEYYFAAFVM